MERNTIRNCVNNKTGEASRSFHTYRNARTHRLSKGAGTAEIYEPIYNLKGARTFLRMIYLFYGSTATSNLSPIGEYPMYAVKHQCIRAPTGKGSSSVCDKVHFVNMIQLDTLDKRIYP